MLLLSRAEEIVLIAIFKLKDNAYGVTIREQVYEDIGHHWAFGIIYRTLKKMKAKGYVERITGEPIAERGGKSRYFYYLTDEGRQALSEIRRINQFLWAKVNV
jgi:DNA-binding PadR family transcriptional regulator